MNQFCTNCVIGMLTGSERGKLMTLPALLKHIEQQKELSELYASNKVRFLFGDGTNNPVCAYAIRDYLSGDKQTDMLMFTYCPICGRQIDAKELLDKAEAQER